MLGQALIGHDLRAATWADFAPLAEMLGRADAVLTDLETAITTRLAEAATRAGVFLHAAPPPVLDCLKEFSVSLLATANNHVWDLGTGGILGMLGELEQRGFAHAGAGADLVIASAPAYRATANGTVALIAFASGRVRDGAPASATRAGVNELRLLANGAPDPGDRDRILGAIGIAAANADAVIAYHHNHIFTEGSLSVSSPAVGGALATGPDRRHPPLWQQGWRATASMPGPRSSSAMARHGFPASRSTAAGRFFTIWVISFFKPQPRRVFTTTRCGKGWLPNAGSRPASFVKPG